MVSVLIILWIVLAIGFRYAIKKARTSKSKLSIFTHPDNYEKPTIEMTNQMEGKGSDNGKEQFGAE